MARMWVRWQDRVSIGDTQVGKGLFAKVKLRRRQVIGEVIGEMIDDPDYGSLYCVDMGGSLSLEPGEPFRYLNHSCEPNCEFVCSEEEADGSSRQLFVEALRTIQPGEELTIDYCWSWDVAIPCLCGSASCRGWIVDPEQLDQIPAVKKSQVKSAQKTDVKKSATSSPKKTASSRK